MARLSLLLFVAALALQVEALSHSPPEIIKQPLQIELLYQVAATGTENKKPIEIECEAKGEPAPKYTWIKNGKPFQWATYDDRMSVQEGRGTLLIERPLDEDLGQYQCFAENEHGIATTNSVFLRKTELSEFKNQVPVIQEVNEGSPFKLTCQPPDGYPKPNIFWMQKPTNGEGLFPLNYPRITLDPEGHLWFSNVTRQDETEDFYYTCMASIPDRNEYKTGNRVLLKVRQNGISASQNRHEPVLQYVSRKNELALRTKSVKLYCIYGGTPLPQTVWKKNNDSIQFTDRIRQANFGKSLEIRNLQFEDAGAYTCEVSNGVGRAKSYSINLQVNSMPYFKTEPFSKNAAEDEDVDWVCEAAGTPEPKISWIHNGKPIEQAPYNPRRTVGSNSIVIKKLKLTDTGNYGCNATNVLGYVYKDFYVNVLALAPEINQRPQKQKTTVDGRNVTLTCKVVGAPKPIVKWIRHGLELTGGRYNIQESGDLLIESVSYVDEGDYTCTATNKLGSVNASGTLVVRKHTRFTDEPTDYEVPAGQSATFRCNAEADPALKMEIVWLRKGTPIDFESHPGFVKSNDNSLTISKATELDSGTYTCGAITDLDEVQANATLIVQDVPNRPILLSTRCNVQNAAVSWEPRGDNRSPILYYTIQYNTSFTPDTWEVAYEKVPSIDSSFTVAMSPWANYTFRVIAKNQIGPSLPSEHGEVCTTQPDVPFKNPDNVAGKGTEPNNLIISWTHMPEIEHNAPHFQYRVSWKRDIPAEKWNIEDIYDWEQSSILIRDQPTFQKYRIKVVAINEQGESSQPAKEVIGYSGEDKPTVAPTNFTLIDAMAHSALLSWNPVPIESVNGHFKGYRVETWTEAEGLTGVRYVDVQGSTHKVLVNKFTPSTRNYARVMVLNGAYTGPASAVLDFETREGVPGSVQTLEARPWGSSAFLLSWKKPLQPNGNLTGYKIYYEQVTGTRVENKQEREPHIDNPHQLQCKLAGLQPNTMYRLHIAATTKEGEGVDYYIDRKTLAGLTGPPDVPQFGWDRLTDDGKPTVRINWRPNLEGHPGSHFYTKYREKGQSEWLRTDDETQSDSQLVRALQAGKSYEFVVVAVDGDNIRESQVQLVDVDGPQSEPAPGVAGAGWFIGMMMAIVFLLLLLICICIIKRNRGGKYDVHDREVAAGRRDFDEGGFHEYSQPMGTASTGRHSIASNLTRPDGDEDGDSLAEYGEGDTGGMSEEGSFIGQYGEKTKQPDPQFATLV